MPLKTREPWPAPKYTCMQMAIFTCRSSRSDLESVACRRAPAATRRRARPRARLPAARRPIPPRRAAREKREKSAATRIFLQSSTVHLLESGLGPGSGRATSGRAANATTGPPPLVAAQLGKWPPGIGAIGAQEEERGCKREGGEYFAPSGEVSRHRSGGGRSGAGGIFPCMPMPPETTPPAGVCAVTVNGEPTGSGSWTLDRYAVTVRVRSHRHAAV